MIDVDDLDLTKDSRKISLLCNGAERGARQYSIVIFVSFLTFLRFFVPYRSRSFFRATGQPCTGCGGCAAPVCACFTVRVRRAGVCVFYR